MAKSIKFEQRRLIKAYADSIWPLDEEGVCWGLSVDFYRFYKKINERLKEENTEKKLSSEDLDKISFLYKQELRKYIDKNNIPEYSGTKKKTEKSFARRVQFYQLFNNKDIPIIQGDDIQDFKSFKKALEGTDYLAVTVLGNKGTHAIPIVALRDEKGNILEYRLLEPNVGEDRNIRTIEELDKVFKDLMQEQPDYTYFKIADYKKIFQGYDLVTNKQIFDSLDKMQRLESLNKGELTEVFQKLFDEGLSAADIYKLIPQDSKVIRYILQEASDLLLSSSDRVYPILEFAMKNKEKDKNLFNDLLTNYPKIFDLKDNGENTLLHLAARKSNPEIMENLIAKVGSDQLAVQNKYGSTVLHIMIQKGAIEIARSLVWSVKMNSDQLAIQDEVGNTALHYAVEAGNKEIVQALIWSSMTSEQIAKQNNEGNTALHLAAAEGHKEIVQTFIMKGMDLAIKDEEGLTALHAAVVQGHRDIADSLAREMSQDQLAIQDEGGKTALHLALKEDQIDIAQFLVSKMSKEACALPDEVGNTALHLALKKGHIKIASDMIWKGLNSDQLAMQDERGYTPLHYAAENGYKGIAETLIYKMKPEQLALSDHKGNTALHLAAANGHVDIVQQLLNEAVPHQENMDGKTPLDMAQTKEIRTILLLAQYGTDPCNLIDKVIEFNKKLATNDHESSMKVHDVFDKDMIAEYLNKPVSSDSGHISETDEEAGYVTITSDEEAPKTPRSDNESDDEKQTKLDIILIAKAKDVNEQKKIEERKKIALRYCTNIGIGSAKTQTVPVDIQHSSRATGVY